MEIHLTETIRAPRDRVFALVNDLDRAGEWLPDGARVERLTEGPTRVGTRYREVRRILGRVDTEEYEVITFDPPRSSEVRADGTRGTAGRGTFRFRIDLEPADGGGTRATLSGSATGMGCLGWLLAPLIRGVMRRAMAADLGALKAWVERQP